MSRMPKLIGSFSISSIACLSRLARITPRVQEGTVFVPMHYREAAANVITNDALDPHVKIPEFKVCAVTVIPAEAAKP